MSSIVGLVKDNSICMGCDSASVDQFCGSIRDAIDQKIFLKGEMLIGVAGSIRVSQVLEHCFELPHHPKEMTNRQYICSIWLRAMVDCFEENNLKITDVNAVVEGQIMIGYRSELFIIYSDLSISYGNILDTIGCGSEHAIAAADTLLNLGSDNYHDPIIISPMDIVHEALRVSAKFSLGVRGPFTIHSLSMSSDNELMYMKFDPDEPDED